MARRKDVSSESNSRQNTVSSKSLPAGKASFPAQGSLENQGSKSSAEGVALFLNSASKIAKAPPGINIEEVFRQMASNIQEIFWMMDAKTNEVIYVSPAFETISGRTVQSLYEDALSYRELIHPDDRARVLERSDELQSKGHFDEEFRIVRPDGEVRWIWVRGIAVPDGDGQITRLAGTARDVSRRKKVEEARERLEDAYRSLFENAPYGIFRSTVDGKLLMANAALVKMLGYKSEAELLKSRSVGEFLREAARDNLVEQLRSEKGFPFVEVPWTRKDGTQILLSVQCHPLGDGTQGQRLIEGTIEDVTQRRILEEQVLQSQKIEAIALMAGGVAHDFNALLTAILGYSERLLMGRDLPENRRREAEEIVQAALQARTLTQQLLAFGRRQVLRLEPLDLNRFLIESRHLLRSLMGEGIELLLFLDSLLLRVKADPGKLTQVIMNLAINARDAMKQGGRLTITTDNAELNPSGSRSAGLTPGKYVLLEVSDTGCGMDRATQERIFDPFFTTKPQGKGTGLGLSTVHGIIEQSGGHITVSSKLGEGTSFRIVLPASTEATEPRDTKEPRQKSLRGLETILVVEDDDLARKLTCENLRESGYEVLAAKNGDEAKIVAQNHHGPIHLLLTDVVMPGMSGERLARLFGSLHPESKVLYVTGYVEAMSVPAAKKDSARFVLQKPFLAHELMGKVREILGEGTKIGSRVVQ